MFQALGIHCYCYTIIVERLSWSHKVYNLLKVDTCSSALILSNLSSTVIAITNTIVLYSWTNLKKFYFLFQYDEVLLNLIYFVSFCAFYALFFFFITYFKTDCV